MVGEDKLQTQNNEAYQARLDAILGTELTPGNIRSYTDDALGQLIGLVGSAIEEYGEIVPEEAYATKRDLEDAALAHFGLQDIESMLDHVDAIGRSIGRLDEVVSEAEKLTHIILPPRPDSHVEPTPQTGPPLPAAESRLLTVLFVLGQSFEVNVHNRDELLLRTGSVTQQVYRPASYYQVVIPELDRIVLVCDQPANITYVLDSRVLANNGVDADQIATMTKDDINRLLIDYPGSGQRVNAVSDAFASAVRDAIEDPVRPVAPGSIRRSDYLRSEITPGAMTLRQFARKLGFDRKTVLEILARTSEDNEAGRAHQMYFGDNIGIALGLTEEQQDAVWKLADAEGRLTELPEGGMTIGGFAESLGTKYVVIQRIVDRLIRDGTISGLPAFGSRRTKYVPLSHQGVIKTAYEAQNANEPAEGTMSMYDFSRREDIHYVTLQRIVRRLVGRGEMDQPSKSSFGSPNGSKGREVLVLDEAQQEAILREYKRNDTSSQDSRVEAL